MLWKTLKSLIARRVFPASYRYYKINKIPAKPCRVNIRALYCCNRIYDSRYKAAG